MMTSETLKSIREQCQRDPLVTADRSLVLQLLDELDIWRPLTPEEAEQALAEAEAVPMSREEIDELVRRATDPGAIITNGEHAQMAARIRELNAKLSEERERVKLLHDATIVLRRGMGGHGHWDATMRHGAGCPMCIKQQEAREEADRLIEKAAIREGETA